MTSPVVQATASEIVSSAADPWAAVNLPASIAAGDMLVVFARTGGAQTFNLPNGWNWLVQNYSADASDDTTSIIWKYADGNEGATFSWDMSATAKGAAIALRISGAGPPILSAVSNGTTASQTPGAPTLPGSRDWLFVVFSSMDGETQTVSAWPTDYTANQLQSNSGTGNQANSNTRMAVATRTATVDTETPAAFTWSAVPVSTTSPGGGVNYTLAFETPIAQAIDAGVTISPTLDGEPQYPIPQAVDAATSLDVSLDTVYIPEVPTGPFTWVNDFEGGVDESLITTADQSSGHPWDEVIVAGGGASGIFWDDVYAVVGALGARMLSSGASGSAVAKWVFSTQQEMWCRVYFTHPGNIAGSRTIIQWLVGDGSIAAGLRFNSGQTVILLDNSSGNVGQSVKAFGAGEQFRIEIHVVFDAVTPSHGHIFAKLFYGANLHGSTPDETFGSESNNVGLRTHAAAWWIGKGGNAAGEIIGVDEVALSNEDWIGSAVEGGGPVEQSLDVTSAFTAALQPQVGKLVAVAATMPAALVRGIRTTIATSMTSVVAMNRRMTKSLSTAVAVAVGIVRRTTHTVATSTTITTTVAGLRTFLRSVVVTTTITVAVGRRVGKRVAALVTASLSLFGRVGKRISAGTTAGVAIRRGVTKSVGVTTVILAGVRRSTTVLIGTLVPVEAALTRRVGLLIEATSELVADIATAGGAFLFQGIDVALGVAVSLSRVFTPLRRLIDYIWRPGHEAEEEQWPAHAGIDSWKADD